MLRKTPALPMVAYNLFFPPVTLVPLMPISGVLVLIGLCHRRETLHLYPVVNINVNLMFQNQFFWSQFGTVPENLCY